MQKGKMVVVVIVIVVFWGAGAFAWEVPDTGQTKCYDGEGVEITCPPPGDPMAQDGSYVHRMSYKKLGYGGVELPDDAEEWLMVRDDVTGLVWEVKQNKDDSADCDNPNDADNQYTWYDSDLLPDETAAGTQGDGVDTFDTEQFIQALNDKNFGGFSDWRMPTIKELDTIVDLESYHPAIDKGVFLNTRLSGYWSATTFAGNTFFAWRMYFHLGNDYGYDSGKSGSYYARAVRSGQ